MFEEIYKALHHEVEIGVYMRQLRSRKPKRRNYRQIDLPYFDGNGKKTPMDDLYYSIAEWDTAWELWHEIHRKRRPEFLFDERIAKRRMVWRWQLEDKTKQESHNTGHR